MTHSVTLCAGTLWLNLLPLTGPAEGKIGGFYEREGTSVCDGADV
jgi:hypothetical protein